MNQFGFLSIIPNWRLLRRIYLYQLAGNIEWYNDVNPSEMEVKLKMGPEQNAIYSIEEIKMLLTCNRQVAGQ